MNAPVPVDPRTTAAAPYAARLVEAVADHDGDATTAALTAAGVPPELQPLVLVLASWVDPETPFAQTIAPGSRAIAARAVTATARRYGIPAADITGPRRTGEVLDARAVAAYAAHRLLGVSSTTTGDVLERDHSTVLHACARVDREPALQRTARQIATNLGWTPGDNTRQDAAS